MITLIDGQCSRKVTRNITISLSTLVITCVNNKTTYSEGAKLQKITVNGLTTIVVDASYLCRSGVWKIEGSLPIKPIDPSVPKIYGLTDIMSVTRKSVNPIILAIDDEYVLYRIVLKTAQVYEVKVFGNQLSTTRDTNFKKLLHR